MKIIDGKGVLLEIGDRIRIKRGHLTDLGQEFIGETGKIDDVCSEGYHTPIRINLDAAHLAGHIFVAVDEIEIILP
jgi:hypothetical protein